MTEATAGAGEATALPGERFLPRGGRVLVVRLSALGDVLFALETVAALRRERPDVAIDFLVEDRFAKLLDGHPQIDRVLVYPRRQRLRIPGSLLALRRTRYDVALDLREMDLDAVYLEFKHESIGCTETCPCCGRKCDQPIQDLNHRHACTLGHQLRAMAGVTVQGFPSFQTCEEIPDDAKIQELKSMSFSRRTQPRPRATRAGGHASRHLPAWHHVALGSIEASPGEVREALGRTS